MESMTNIIISKLLLSLSHSVTINAIWNNSGAYRYMPLWPYAEPVRYLTDLKILHIHNISSTINKTPLLTSHNFKQHSNMYNICHLALKALMYLKDGAGNPWISQNRTKLRCSYALYDSEVLEPGILGGEPPEGSEQQKVNVNDSIRNKSSRWTLQNNCSKMS